MFVTIYINVPPVLIRDVDVGEVSDYVSKTKHNYNYRMDNENSYPHEERYVVSMQSCIETFFL